MDGLPQLSTGTLLMAAAAGALYVASRVMLGVLKQWHDTPSSRAIAQWLPIALVTLVAAVMRMPELAVGVIFATSLACLTLVLGIVGIYQPFFDTNETRRPLWGMVLPLSLIALICGFAGEFKLLHGVIFLFQGIVIFFVARQDESLSQPHLPAEPGRKHPALRGIEIVLAVLLGGLGAWATTRGVTELSGNAQAFTPGLLASLLVSPLLVLPMIGGASSNREAGEDATSTLVIIALLNLCLLLPLTIFTWLAMRHWWWAADVRLPFPMPVWRLDTVLLIVTGFALLGVSRGSVRLGTREGAVLVLAYGLYVFTAALTGIRV